MSMKDLMFMAVSWENYCL